MKDVADDPPPSLAEAEVLFARFLTSHGYPGAVHWVHEAGIDFDRYPNVSVRSTHNRLQDEFEQCYLKALTKGLGVELAARCASQDHTFAVIFAPEDNLDRQCHMMGRGLKLSCPTSLVPGSFEMGALPSNGPKWGLGARAKGVSQRLKPAWRGRFPHD